MSVDDGVGAGADLDPAIDGLVVMINATNQPQSIGDFRDGKGSAHRSDRHGPERCPP